MRGGLCTGGVPCHAGQGGGVAAVAHAAIRGEPGAPTILDAPRVRLRASLAAAIMLPTSCSNLRPARACLPFSRARGRQPGPERTRWYPRPTAQPPVSGCGRHPSRRGAHPRPSRRYRAPSVVLMNRPSQSPPMSTAGSRTGAASLSSALARLAEGGRLVAITGANLSPDNPSGATALSECSNAAASCSRRPSMAGPMPPWNQR